MSDQLTEREYLAEIQSIAEGIRSECEGDDEREYEQLHETIYSHQWVTYTYRHYQVLAISDNDGACVKNFGSDELVKDGELNTALLTYCAMEADVQEVLSELPDFEADAEVTS